MLRRLSVTLLKHKKALLVGGLSVLLGVLAFPGGDLAEAVYGMFIPFTLWALSRPKRKVYLWTAFLASWVLGLVVCRWLLAVPVGGVFLWLGLTVYGAAFYFAFLVGLRFFVERYWGKVFGARLLGFLGIASLWVILEWARGFVLSGLPWLPLSATQWERPVILQWAAYAGGYGVSFLLIMMNLWLAYAFQQVIAGYRVGLRSLRKHLPSEFYLALGVFALSALLFTQNAPWKYKEERLFDLGIVQPDVSPDLKWDTEAARENLEVLAHETEALAAMGADLVLWPEAATPFPTHGELSILPWIGQLTEVAPVAILFGNLTFDEVNERAYNGLFLYYPESGLELQYYTKQHCVPFGEYVPFRKYLPFLNKIVPLELDVVPGELGGLISFRQNGRVLRMGGLICYEDIFPALARTHVLNGADVLVVVTNDAWFGNGTAAYQHAAHSVLLAAENQRPVIRCGNNGWSGWIDGYGRIRHVSRDSQGRIDFQGSDLFEVGRFERFVGRLSFYTRFGDWLIGLAFGLLGAAFAYSRPRRFRPSSEII